jgi:hypothetical protein
MDKLQWDTPLAEKGGATIGVSFSLITARMPQAVLSCSPACLPFAALIWLMEPMPSRLESPGDQNTGTSARRGTV